MFEPSPETTANFMTIPAQNQERFGALWLYLTNISTDSEYCQRHFSWNWSQVQE